MCSHLPKVKLIISVVILSDLHRLFRLERSGAKPAHMSATREKWIVVLFASSVRPPPIALGEKKCPVVQANGATRS